jgi:hypothetical protein
MAIETLIFVILLAHLAGVRAALQSARRHWSHAA